MPAQLPLRAFGKKGVRPLEANRVFSAFAWYRGGLTPFFPNALKRDRQGDASTAGAIQWHGPHRRVQKWYVCTLRATPSATHSILHGILPCGGTAVHGISHNKFKNVLQEARQVWRYRMQRRVQLPHGTPGGNADLPQKIQRGRGSNSRVNFVECADALHFAYATTGQ